MITIKALPPSRRPSLLPRASSQGFAQSIMQKYRHGEGRDPGYLALIHRDFSPSIGGQENHFHQNFIRVRMQVQVDSYLGLNREMLPNGQAGLPWPKERAVITQASGSGRKVQPATLIHELFRKWESSQLIEKVAPPLLKAIVSDRKETVRERFWTPETPYVSPKFLVHTARMGELGGLKSMQNARERIRLESATSVDAISHVRATRSEAGRFERFGIRNFLQLIGRRMESRIGTWSFPVLLKRAEGRAASAFLDRSVWTERAGIDGKDITRLIVHESESTRWSVASQQTELWWRWWENLSLYWQKSRATSLPRTSTAHPRLHALQPIVFARSRQHPQSKSEWILETLSEVSYIPLELKILQSYELSKMFSSVLPSMLHRADTGRTKQQAVRERFKQLFHLAQQFSKAESERGLAVLGPRESLKQIERGREQQPNSITFHPLQRFPFESIATRNQRTYALLQQLILQEARLNERVREQGLSRTVPLLSQSVVRKSIAAYWIKSFQSANAPVFFEKRGWLNQPWIKEYLETLNEIEREPAGRAASTARFVWNRFGPIFHTNRQRWQTLQNRIVSYTHQETNRKSVMAWVQVQQMAEKQLRARELLATSTHAPRNLLYEPENQSLHPAASMPSRWLMPLLNFLIKENASVSNHAVSNHIEGISQPFFQPRMHFLQDRHVYQLSYETVRQLLSFQGRKNKLADVAFSKNQEKFSLPGRKATISMVHEHEHRPIRHTVFLKNERSTSRAFVHTHRHDREAVFLRLNRLGSAMLRATEWIGLGGTDDQQQWYNTSAKSFSIKEDISVRNSLRGIAAGWSAELGLTILLQKSAKLVAMSEFAKVGSISASGKAPPSSEKQSNDHPRSRKGESNPLRESRQSRESRHSSFLQQTASLWTNSVALRARPYLQVMEQIRKAIQTDFRTEAYVQNHHSLSTVLNRHDAQMIVQKHWGPLSSLVHGQSVGGPDSFMHGSGSRRATERLLRKGRVNSLEPLSRHHPISSVPFVREKSIDFVWDRLHSRQLSRRSRFQQTNHEQILTVNQKAQTIKRLTSEKTQEVEVRDARLTSLQRPGLFNPTSTTPMAKHPPHLQRLQQAQRTPGESGQRSLSENATHIHRRALRTEDNHASPAATVQSPPSMEYLRKSIPPQETAVQQTTTLPLQRQVDLHVQERAGNQTSLSSEEVDRLMDKMMKELDKRLTQERQRRGL
jgi:hypothetical protein